MKFPTSLAASFATASIFLTSHLYNQPKTSEQLAELGKSSVVTIKAEGTIGTGFFFNKRGDILTVNHVVKDAKSLKVKDQSGREWDATVVYADASLDFAVLHTKAKKHAFLQLAHNLCVKDGSKVIEVGAPYGLENTVTQGIVSCYRKDSKGTYIQFDAPTNPGNSGSPVLCENGTVVGIAESVYAVNRGGTIVRGAGLSFAVPISLVLKKFDELRF